MAKKLNNFNDDNKSNGSGVFEASIVSESPEKHLTKSKIEKISNIATQIWNPLFIQSNDSWSL